MRTYLEVRGARDRSLCAARVGDAQLHTLRRVRARVRVRVRVRASVSVRVRVRVGIGVGEG